MRLVLVPLDAFDDEGWATHRPRIPESVLARPLSWGGAASKWRAEDKALCWVRASDAEIQEIASYGMILDRLMDHAPAGEIVKHLLRSAPDFARQRDVIRRIKYQGHSTVSDRQYLHEYGDRIAAFHRAPLADLNGPVEAAVRKILKRGLLRAGPGATLAQDAFTGVNGTLLTAHTMTDGAGTWATGATSCQINANAAKAVTGTESNYCDSEADRADAKVTVLPTLTYKGALALVRYSDTSNYYAVLMSGSSYIVTIRTLVAGTSTDYSGTAASPPGDTIAIKAEGTTLTAYLNGAVNKTQTGESDHSTGRGGILQLINRAVDDWLYESIAAAGNPWYYYAQQRSASCGSM